MPSTFLANNMNEVNLKEEDTILSHEPKEESQCRDDTKTSFVDLSPNKPNSTKSLGSKIKEETRKLMRYPGKALKRSCPSEESFAGDEVFIDEDFSAFFKEHDILMEFKYVCKNPPSGVYVIPSMKSIQVWHGMIFVRAGPFKEGIFRFDILLPDNFPSSAPLVRFTSRVFHPQVHLNGVLNLEQAFPIWKKGESHINDVLKYIKSSFYNMNTWNALNQDAVACINSNLDEFKAKAHECVVESLRKFNEESAITSEDDGNLLKARTTPLSIIKEWKQQLLCEDSL